MLRSVRRGILGGTFDPPHIAHLVAGEAAYRELGLDVVSFVPAGAPWQKAGTDVSIPAHRWAMTRLAVDGVPYFDPDDREVSRDGWSYTVDTLETFPPDDVLVLILGADAAAGIPTWRRYEEVLARVSLAVMSRPGVPPEEVTASVGEHHALDTPELAISGTMIRRRRRRGAPIRFLVPEAVHGYIEANDLYAG
jgi:nicotinate-nucleotide adenylyltransferase